MLRYFERFGSDDLFVLLIIVGFIYFVVREINCWYWKINTIVNRLDRLDSKLDSLDIQLESINSKLNYICEKGIKVQVVSVSNTNIIDNPTIILATQANDNPEAESVINTNPPQVEEIIGHNEIPTDNASINKSKWSFLTKKYYIRNLFKKRTD